MRVTCGGKGFVGAAALVWVAVVLAGCDDEAEGTADTGAGDASSDAGSDSGGQDATGDASSDQGTGGAAGGAWVLLVDGLCGMVVEQSGTTLTGSVYGDGSDEVYTLTGTVTGAEVAFAYEIPEGPSLTAALTIDGDNLMAGSLSADGAPVGDLFAIRSYAGVVVACQDDTSYANDVTDGWVGVALDGFCGLTLTQTGSDVTGQAYGDRASEVADVTGTVTSSDVALEYTFSDSDTTTLTLVLDPSGITLDGTISDGVETQDIRFARVVPGAIEDCAGVE